MKMIRKQVLMMLAAVLVLVLSACTLPADAPSATPTAIDQEAAPSEPAPQSDASGDLVGVSWQLESYGAPGAETPVVTGTEVTLLLDAGGDASGSAGCNSFGGQYSAAGGQIAFSQLISTLMACVDNSVMTQEQVYLQALQAAGTYSLAGDQLTITTQDGATVLNFVPNAAVQPTEAPISTLMCEPSEAATANGWTTCRSLLYGFELRYPAGAVLAEQRADYARINLPVVQGTNLTEKYLEIEFADTSGACTSPLAEGHAAGTIPQETVMFNGQSFLKQTGSGVATGNFYEWEAYSIQSGNLCISLDFVLHSYDPELAPTPPPKFDRAAEAAVFPQIAETFAWVGMPQYTGEAVTPTSTPEAVVRATPEPERITFDPGAISDTVSGSVLANGMNAYVLRAMAGQTMQVNLSFSQGEAILIIWGEDGTVLISDHAGATTFTGELPLTEDYYIHVRGNPDTATTYQMEIIIQ